MRKEAVQTGPMKKQPTAAIRLILLIFFIILGLLFIGKLFFASPKQQASAAVNQFYTFEQDGDFYSSWSLFHSLMQNKLAKGPYMEDRAHVFMNQFDVETFTFDVSKPKKVKDWQMAGGAPVFELAYCMTVAQFYESKYGNFTIYQQVFAVEEEGEWRILWDYNQ